MKINVRKYSKFIVALVAAVTVFGAAASDGEITVEEAVATAAAFAGALGVRQVTNKNGDVAQ